MFSWTDGLVVASVSVVKVQRTQFVECLDGAVEILAVDSLDAYPEDLELNAPLRVVAPWVVHDRTENRQGPLEGAME